MDKSIQSERAMDSEDVAFEIHILLRLHETSIVERHRLRLAGDATCADKPIYVTKAAWGAIGLHELEVSMNIHILLTISILFKDRTFILPNYGIRSDMCADN